MPISWEARIFSRECKFLAPMLIVLHWLEAPKEIHLYRILCRTDTAWHPSIYLE